ncbi:hypothetical protein [Riemerella columbipharyngis]|uniref:Uncharacterized protein n=1 Tax=Riemerella columbipharyngis TaxID=1071918 RepID=A0A1G6ZD50_9FLAO|nr:hypothetical protein [Riemerella columbipharyngis]SDE00451.1 hypothetical protein SAMN05421544_10243 [Riemerella columbipharyngis]
MKKIILLVLFFLSATATTAFAQSQTESLSVTSIRANDSGVTINTVDNKVYKLNKGDTLTVYLPYNGRDFMSIKPKRFLNTKLLSNVADIVSDGASVVGLNTSNIGTMMTVNEIISKTAAFQYSADALEKIQDLSISKTAKKIAGKTAKILDFQFDDDSEDYSAVVEINGKKYIVELATALMSGEVQISH